MPTIAVLFCRRTLRDAELGADDACQRLVSSRAECHALAVELRENRQQHREEVLRLSEAHDARIKECADRLSLDGASLPQPPLGGHGTKGRRRGATATVAASVASSPVAAAIAELAAQWRAFVSNGVGDEYENDGNNKSRRRQQRTSVSPDVAGSNGGGYRPGNEMAAPSGGGSSKGTIISERQLTATTTFLQETAVRLDTECSRAVRRARALEWELAGARRGQLDATTALEEAREEVCRLSARAAVAEASVTAAAAVPSAGKPSYAGDLAESSSSSAMPGSGGCGEIRFGGDNAGEEAATGTGRWSYYTIAAVSLLEKRFAAAVEDLVAAGAARAAAVAGEAAANARADAAEATVRESLARADLLTADLERHKVSTTDGAAAEWRREIRAELGRWWKDDLVSWSGPWSAGESEG